MGKTHQAGWVSLRGKMWYGYFRRRVLDPKTEENRVDIVCVQLGPKTRLTKSGAREALRMEVAKQTGQNLGGRVRKDSSTSFEWFVRNRYFPLRQGDWRPETAKEKMSQIELDLIGKFGEFPLESIDRFMLQTMSINSLIATVRTGSNKLAPTCVPSSTKLSNKSFYPKPLPES